MNIAFGTVLILFLLTPGFALRYSFLQGPYSRTIYKPTFTEELFWSILPAVLIQLLGLSVLGRYYQISIVDTYLLLIGSDRSDINFQLIWSSIPGFIGYQLVLLSMSLFFGYLLREFILRMSLDKKLNFLKINNDWYYLFSGRILDQPGQIEFVQVDALVGSDNGNLIYCGILNNYFLSPEGSIDKIYLSNVYRRSLSEDLTFEDMKSKKFTEKEFDERYYNMPGEYFVLFGNQILNINVTYYYLKED